MGRFRNGLIILFFLNAPAAWAFFTPEDTGTSAAVLLTQPASARWLALGGAGTAAAIGAEGLWWNPATLASYPYFNTEIALRQQWEATELGFCSLAMPTSWGVPALGLTYTQSRNIEGYDAEDNSTGYFATRDFQVKLGYAWQWDHLALGLAGSWLQQNLHAAKINGLSVDAGLAWEFYPGVKIGASVLNLGQTQVGDPLATEVRLGWSIQAFPAWQLVYDIVAPREQEIYLAAGGEWKPWDFMAWRMGWHNGPADVLKLGGLTWLTAGLGLAWNNFYLDYVFEPFGSFGQVHHVSLGYRYSPLPPAPKPLPTPIPLVEPTFKVEPRAYQGQLVYVPKPVAQNFKAREFQFTIRDPAGKVVRTFKYAGAALPRQIVWDGTDENRQKMPEGNFSFTFEYITDQGIKQEEQAWPNPLPARKLLFSSGGVGIAPEVFFRFEGERSALQSWKILIQETQKKNTIRTLSGQGTLPETVLWDGIQETGEWAPPNLKYVYVLELVSSSGAQVTIRKPIITILAQMLSQQNQRVQFKIIEILFEFRKSEIRVEVADKIEKAIEIYKHYGPAAQIRIEGHADEIGSEWANINISRQRAQKVKKFMREKGIAPDWELSTLGFGKKIPVYKGKDEKGRAQNRRVEIVFDLPGKEQVVPGKGK